MATVWARTSGNWSGSVWDWINPETEQVEANPYASPQSGDYVYLNGYAINLSNNINIGNGTISNAENPNTGRTGGYFNYTQSTTTNWNYIANFVVDGVQMIRATGNRAAFHCTVNGNISLNNAPFYKNTSTTTGTWGGQEFYINGNITGNFYLIDYDNTVTTSPTISVVRIVGTYASTATIASHGINVLTVVGETSRVNATTANITGTISTRINSLNAVCVFTTLNINGKIEYHSNNNSMGVIYANLNILNPDTFTWHDISEPRSNPFIILTDAEMNNRQQYPAENEVKEGTEYVWGEKVGTYQQPPESVVLKGYVYDNGDKIGSLENQNVVGCVTKEDVREGVELIGLQEVGTLVVPSVDDVREGVVFDNGSVGTLIVQGGGDRLRIADFGYYTRSTSITYIVDLTESDKPAFADCEEIVLRSLFPTLDLDNIPDKFFDDLFVQFLRYRLLVEYYRGTSINSKFTPSEPTAEIVNYANTKCEYWLNTANLFLQLWGEKYPNSVKRDRILL